ncbi:MlaE family ABC transporter permease [Actinomadura macrotermitis]|uniref:Putative phospholipid ABC transporter permease protein MlaE n=1 Tax=Actinomadura macrotermitis TaxID=2585200 RepID=A0A7K0BZR6_9ACTN|nr:ABC transporter permease [Actinomadura macrotermitis]MQY06661.1 putative phospholipid ABC transporter permease protein MlaE [Actinomadura macrotermitis]
MVASSPVSRLGRALQHRTAGLAPSADLPVFLGRVLYHLFVDIIARRKYGRTLAKQVSDITVGVGALVIGGGMIFVIATMSLATGAMVGLQGYPGLERIGAEAFTGLVASYSNVREVTPIIAGVALVAQVGTGFTAEIGAMRISEEIDALEVMGINSLAYLVCTRVAAGVIALVPLYLVSLFAAFFATRFITINYYGLSPGIYDYYFHLYLPPIDVFYSVIKVAVFAFIVMFIHCYRGYYAAGGPVGVGVAAGRAIRESTILMILMNLVLSYIFWGHGSTVRLTG